MLLTSGLALTGTAHAATAEDTTPPSVALHGPGPVVLPRPTLDFSWTATDAGGGPLTYQVQTGTRPHTGGTIAWGDPEPTTETAASIPPAVSPDEACFQVLVSDPSGNTGEAEACTYVDDSAPWILWAGAWRPIAPHLSRTPVTVRYTGGDDDRVASYDVLARVALTGRAWGPWATLAGRISATSVRRTWPAGSNVCFLARARDRVGHLTQTNAVYDRRCTAIPYDDRGLTRSPGAVRARSSWALGGTVTVLSGRASLTGPRTPMRSVWISMRSRGGYCPRLWVGGQRIAQWRCHWYPISGRPGYLYALPRTMSGKAVLRAGTYDRVRVDTVAFAR